MRFKAFIVSALAAATFLMPAGAAHAARGMEVDGIIWLPFLVDIAQGVVGARPLGACGALVDCLQSPPEGQDPVLGTCP